MTVTLKISLTLFLISTDKKLDGLMSGGGDGCDGRDYAGRFLFFQFNHFFSIQYFTKYDYTFLFWFNISFSIVLKLSYQIFWVRYFQKIA